MVWSVFSVVVLVAAACGSLASPTPSRRAGYVVHEKRDTIPAAWSRVRRLESDTVLRMRFGLKQNNLDKLEEMLMDISHPDSPNYGQHWSVDKIADTFRPSYDTINAVKIWLEESGMDKDRMRLSPSRGWIDINATAAEIEELLDTEYHVYTHETTGQEHAGMVVKFR